LKWERKWIRPVDEKITIIYLKPPNYLAIIVRFLVRELPANPMTRDQATSGGKIAIQEHVDEVQY
jgi:hypothetical protein